MTNTKQTTTSSNIKSTLLISIPVIAPGESLDTLDKGGEGGADGDGCGADGGKKIFTKSVTSAFEELAKPNRRAAA